MIELMRSVNGVLAWLTLLSQASLIAITVYWLFTKRAKRSALLKFFDRHYLKLSLLFVSVATAASLFYSEIVGIEPCKLCWLQRIFIYPLVVIFIIAIVKKSRQILDYVLALSVIGALISVYHNYIYYTAAATAGCPVGGTVSCTRRYVFELGYVSIPMMALTTLVLVIAMTMLAKSYHKDKTE